MITTLGISLVGLIASAEKFTTTVAPPVANVRYVAASSKPEMPFVKRGSPKSSLPK